MHLGSDRCIGSIRVFEWDGSHSLRLIMINIVCNVMDGDDIHNESNLMERDKCPWCPRVSRREDERREEGSEKDVRESLCLLDQS